MGYLIPSTGVRGGLGATSGDYGAVYSEQRNQARATFGDTGIPLPGRTDIGYPNMSGALATQLIAYWANEVNRVQPSSILGFLSKWYVAPVLPLVYTVANFATPPDSAFLDQWNRAVENFQNRTPSILKTAQATGTALMSVSSAVELWDLLDPIVLGMKGVKETPSSWDITLESVKEAIFELPEYLPSLIIPAWMKWATLGAAAFYVFQMLPKKKERR